LKIEQKKKTVIKVPKLSSQRFNRDLKVCKVNLCYPKIRAYLFPLKI
jgi:hypothetical protein